MMNRKNKKYVYFSVCFLIMSTWMGYSFAGCTPCDANADNAWFSMNSCPTWCCSAGLSYPVTQVDCTTSNKNDCEGNSSGYECYVGSFGCAKGAAGCDAPCGC